MDTEPNKNNGSLILFSLRLSLTSFGFSIMELLSDIQSKAHKINFEKRNSEIIPNTVFLILVWEMVDTSLS